MLDPLFYTIGNDLVMALECGGRYDESLASARQTLRNDPKYAYAHVPLGAALSMNCDFTAANNEFEQAIQSLGRGAWILGPMGYALARAGRMVEAANIVREIELSSGGAMELGHVYAALGEKPRTLDALDRAHVDVS